MAGSPQQTALERLARPDRFAISADHVGIQASLAKAGAGIAMLRTSSRQATTHSSLFVPRIRPLLREIWVVFHTDMKTAAPVRAVIESFRADAMEGGQFDVCFRECQREDRTSPRGR